MNGIKPSHYRTPRTLQECSFTPGYKGGKEEGEEETNSWLLILVIFLGLLILGSFSFSSISSLS